MSGQWIYEGWKMPKESCTEPKIDGAQEWSQLGMDFGCLQKYWLLHTSLALELWGLRVGDGHQLALNLGIYIF